MRYRNSSVYVQRMIDKVLWEQQQFVWAYVNDIVIFFNILNEHLQHLNSVFKVLANRNICLSLKKSFLDYFSVKLLDQKVNTLNLITAVKKLEVITQLKFSKSLSTLKKYLDLIRYLQQYILRYAVISKSLQEQKMLLNKIMRKWSSKSVKNTVRKKAVQRVKVEMLTSQKLQIFNQLQAMFFKSIILAHFNLIWQLYIDLNALKEFRFRAHVYHHWSDREIKAESISDEKQKNMKSIYFLSSLLADAETRYWLIELKIADLVWVIQKIHYMIESVIKVTIIYTDYFIIVNTVHQSSLSITLTEKINLCLIWALKYLQHFCLNIHYKFDKFNVILHALFRLTVQNYCQKSDASTLNTFYTMSVYNSELTVYSISLVKLNREFWECLITEYIEGIYWVRVKVMIEANIKLVKNASALLYKVIDEMIYYKDSECSL